MGGGEDHVAVKAHLLRNVRLQLPQLHRRLLGLGGEEPFRQAQGGAVTISMSQVLRLASSRPVELALVYSWALTPER